MTNGFNILLNLLNAISLHSIAFLRKKENNTVTYHFQVVLKSLCPLALNALSLNTIKLHIKLPQIETIIWLPIINNSLLVFWNSVHILFELFKPRKFNSLVREIPYIKTIMSPRAPSPSRDLLVQSQWRSSGVLIVLEAATRGVL